MSAPRATRPAVRSRRGHGVAPTSIAIAALLLAACGSSAASGQGTTTGPSIARAFCSNLLQFDKLPGPTAARAARLKATAPPTLRHAVAALPRSPVAAVSSPPAVFADGLVHAWAHDNCGFMQIDVKVGDENGYDGIANEQAPGPVSFQIVSTAEHEHQEFLLVYRSANSTQPILDQLDALRTGRVSQFRRIVDVTVAPGKTAGRVATLVAGDYVVVSTQPDPTAKNEPKYQHGMVTEFTVGR
jgi:hypothetical protein